MGDFLSHIGGALGGVLTGGLTGIVGVIVQRVADYKNKQLDLQMNAQKYAHETEMKEVDLKMMSQEWAARTTIASTEAAGAVEVADAGGFTASQSSEPKQFSVNVAPTATQGLLLVLLDCVRGLVRPVLTLYLCVLTTMVYYQCKKMLGYALTPEQALGILGSVINTILYLTTVCVTWWFGTRNKGPSPALNK